MLPHVQPRQHTCWSRSRLRPSVLASTQTCLLHGEQVGPLSAIKNWRSDGNRGKLQPREETQGPNPGVITTVMVARSDSPFFQNFGAILRHRVAPERQSANSLRIIWQGRREHNIHTFWAGLSAGRAVLGISQPSACGAAATEAGKEPNSKPNRSAEVAYARHPTRCLPTTAVGLHCLPSTK